MHRNKQFRISVQHRFIDDSKYGHYIRHLFGKVNVAFFFRFTMASRNHPYLYRLLLMSYIMTFHSKYVCFTNCQGLYLSELDTFTVSPTSTSVNILISETIRCVTVLSLNILPWPKIETDSGDIVRICAIFLLE